jgi:hypothetical protein
MPDSGINSSRVCLALSVALSGFLFTLLAVYSSRTLWNHFSGPSVHGVLPFRVFHPLKSRTPLGAACSHALRSPRERPCSTKAPGLQSFTPFKEPYTRTSHYTESGAATLLGFPSSEALLPSNPVLFRETPSSALSPASEETGAVP